MSVVDLAKKIKDMATYSNQALYEPDKSWKINQFKFFIRGGIGHSLYHQKFNVYVELLQQCYVAEIA